MRCFSLIIILYTNLLFATFSPDTSNYDAYGIKIAANDVLFVEAQNEAQTFLVQFVPYNYTFGSLQCSIDFDDPAHYVYSVGVGIEQNTTLNSYFYFAGEVVPQGWSNTDQSGRNGTFIGVWINQDPQDILFYSNTRQPLSCNYFQIEQLQFLQSYDHQEYFIIAVEPYGKYAIGLAVDFAFIYQPFPISNITTKSASTVWPNNSTFYPCAADASETYTIVAGFVKASAQSRVRATPTVYLITNANLTICSTWSYSATNNTWQSRLTYSSIDTWNTQYTMSVKINANDPTHVSVGMPFLNTVFFFLVQNNNNLTLLGSMNNGKSVGFGKSVAWLTQTQAAILVSTYSLDYSTWYSSKLYIYTSFNGTSYPALPTAVFPNSQQPLPSTMNSKLIQMVSTPESVAILDVNGGVTLILSEQAGYYASTDTSNSPVAAAMPVVSISTMCIAGTYKSDAGIYPCLPCPIGSYNPANLAAISCLNCSSNSFCPLGAVYEMDVSSIVSISQAYAYPRSPDLIVYEDILLNNMFAIGSTTHCILVSPIFWASMLIAFFGLLLLVMTSMNCCVHEQKRERWQSTIKNVFQRTDLIGEGELWLGGIVSLAVVLVIGMAYGFAISFLNLYPSEKVEGSLFICDQTLRNANFESSLQALAVPISNEEQIIFTLLNEQNFTLQFGLINTQASCQSLSLSEITDSSTISLNIISCSNGNGTLSASAYLPQHAINIQVTIDDIKPIGGIRIGLSGPSQENGSYTLNELNFTQSFYSSSSLTLSQMMSISMAITKTINETEPLSGDESEFSGIWYPTFTYSTSEMFVAANYYTMYTNLTLTTITIDISETSYYIKNVESPIAKKAEIIFRTLLFAFLCLEICATAFVIVKLLLIPLYERIYACFIGRPVNVIEPEQDHKEHHP